MASALYLQRSVLNYLNIRIRLLILKCIPVIISESSINRIRQAEKAGFKAVVVTIDTPQLGNRLALKRDESK